MSFEREYWANYPLENPPLNNPLGEFYELERYASDHSTLVPLAASAYALCDSIRLIAHENKPDFYRLGDATRAELLAGLLHMDRVDSSLSRLSTARVQRNMVELSCYFLRKSGKGYPATQERNENLARYLELLLAEFERLQGVLTELDYLLENRLRELQLPLARIDYPVKDEHRLLAGFFQGRNRLMLGGDPVQAVDSCVKASRVVFQELARFSPELGLRETFREKERVQREFEERAYLLALLR